MQLDAKTNKIIIDYVLEYYQKSRKTKKAVPGNMWGVITKHTNGLLELKQRNCDTSNLIKMKSDVLCAYFERSLILQLENLGFSEDEFFTLAYPHVNVVRNIEIVFISNHNTTFNIPDDTLQMLLQIIKYHLNRYTFEYEIWDLFEKLYFTGIRKLELNVENSLFGLNNEEKRKLILDSHRERTRARLFARMNINSKNNSSVGTATEESSDTNIQLNTDLSNVGEIGGDTISTPNAPNPFVDSHANQLVVENVVTVESVELARYEKDDQDDPCGIGIMFNSPNPVIEAPVEDDPSGIGTMSNSSNRIIEAPVEDDPSGIGTMSNSPNPVIEAPVEDESGSDQPLSSDIDLNTEKNIICERHTKTKTVEPLVHWSLLFELYEKDTC